jgi:transposase
VLERHILDAARHDPVCRRLTSVAGVGPITALAFTSSLDDLGRFRDLGQVGAWLGLLPRRYRSGQLDHAGRISKAGDGLVRALLFEAAHVLLSRVRRRCALKDWALRLAARAGRKKAKVALARKLAVLLARLWQRDATFDWRVA